MKIEQDELRDAARQLLTGLGPDTSRAEASAAIRDAGWLGITVPEALGGLDQSLSAACWLHLEIGHALSPAPLLPALLAVEALTACPPSPERDAWVERIIGGEAPAVSLLEPAGLTIAGGSISGTVSGVASAQAASHALIVVAEEPLVALVALDQAGVQVVPHPTWDQSRDLSDLVLNVALADVLVLARGSDAGRAMAALSTHLHFGIAADSIGAADAILDQTVSYLKERRQYDRPLAMFQALKHRCADLKVAVAAAQALLADYLNEVEGGSGNPVALARAAKSIGSSTFRAVAEESVQLHGGMGMTSEHACHLFLKRALLNEHLASADDACDLAVGEDLLVTVRA